VFARTADLKHVVERFRAVLGTGIGIADGAAVPTVSRLFRYLQVSGPLRNRTNNVIATIANFRWQREERCVHLCCYGARAESIGRPTTGGQL
jgi:hypothetical protein